MPEEAARRKAFTLSLLSVRALQRGTAAHEVRVPEGDRNLAPPRALPLLHRDAEQAATEHILGGGRFHG